MSDDSARVWEPREIVRFLLADERELFLNEYWAALDDAHNTERYPELQEVLRRWTSIVTHLGEVPSFQNATPGHCAW